MRDESASPTDGDAIPADRPDITGDVVFGAATSPVAVCTLASRTLLPALAGRREVAVAGRVYTENIGIERMVQNLGALPTVRFLIVCGRETRHHVGQTILALHRFGLDDTGRVIGSDAPDPVMPNLTAEQLRRFQREVEVIDLIGVVDAETIIARAAELGTVAPTVSGDPSEADHGEASPIAAPAPDHGEAPTEHVIASRDPAEAWVYDPAGYFLVFVDEAHQQLRVEQYDQGHRRLRVIWGRQAPEIEQTIVRLGLVTLLPHAAYLGRELGRAESALRLGLPYEQDRPLTSSEPPSGGTSGR